jgi:hypothetical protein
MVLTLTEQEALEHARFAKLREQINAESWTYELESLMKTWVEKAAGCRKLHTAASAAWTKTSNRLYVPLILFTTIGGVANVGAAESNVSNYWMYAIGAINIMASFLVGTIKYYQPDEKAQAHMISARMFGSFFRRITLQLSLARDAREPSESLCLWAINEYDRLQNDAPFIPQNILAEYKRTHEFVINKPDIAMEHFDIQIYREILDTSVDITIPDLAPISNISNTRSSTEWPSTSEQI